MITSRVILDASLYGNDKSIFVQQAKKLNLIRIEIQTNNGKADDGYWTALHAWMDPSDRRFGKGKC